MDICTWICGLRVDVVGDALPAVSPPRTLDGRHEFPTSIQNLTVLYPHLPLSSPRVSLFTANNAIYTDNTMREEE
jgi:hypothetical protein